MQKTGENNVDYRNRYMTDYYDRLSVVVPKGRKDDIAVHAASKGTTINGLVNMLLQAEMGIDEKEWGMEKKDLNKKKRR